MESDIGFFESFLRFVKRFFGGGRGSRVFCDMFNIFKAILTVQRFAEAETENSPNRSNSQHQINAFDANCGSKQVQIINSKILVFYSKSQ